MRKEFAGFMDAAAHIKGNINNAPASLGIKAGSDAFSRRISVELTPCTGKGKI